MAKGTFAPEDDVAAIVQMFGARLKDAAQPLTLVVRMKMRDGTRDEVDAAFALARQATLKDAGVIAFDLNRDASDPNVIVVYERWRNLHDLEGHLRTPHATAHRQAFNELVAGLPEFTVLTPVTV